MSFDYNYFTKAELVSFLNEHGSNFKYTTKPYQIILDKKMDEINKKIDKTLDHNAELIEILKDENLSDAERMEASISLSGNHELFMKLNNQLDKLFARYMEVE